MLHAAIRGLLVILGTAAFFTSIGSYADESIRPISGAKSVLAVYTQSYGIAANGLAPHRLIFVAWDDGYVVWSDRPIEGGESYRAGHIEPVRLNERLAALAKDGLLKDELLARPQFGPSSHTTVIFAKSKAGELKMQSWHELYEVEGKVVATAGGLAPLDGQPKFVVLRKEKAEYLFYRLAWDELRLSAASLIPGESKPVKGSLQLRRGKAYWMETPAP